MTSASGQRGRGFLFVWGVPILLGVLSVFGLLAATVLLLGRFALLVRRLPG